MSEKKTEKTEEELSKEIQELSQKKAQAFAEEYNKLVEKHKMKLVGVATITPEGIQTGVDIRPL